MKQKKLQEASKTFKTLTAKGLIDGVITHDDQLKIDAFNDVNEWTSAVRHMGVRNF